MNNIIEYLKLKTQNNESGFEPSDFSMLGLASIPSNQEIDAQNEEYKHYIEELINDENNPESSKFSVCGEGKYKKAYLFDSNKILLKSYVKVLKPSRAFFNALALKKLGVNIAMPLLFTTEKSSSDDYFHSGYYSYQIQEEAKGSFVSVLRTNQLIKHISSFNQNINEDYLKSLSECDIKDQYNLAMAKHRAQTGMPFIKNFMFDFCILNRLSFADLHTENVFYNSHTGYTFFDLDPDIFLFDALPNESYEQSNIMSKIKSKLEKYANAKFETHNYDFGNFIISMLGVTPENYIPKPITPENFAQHVYNGIITHQLLEAMKTNIPENECYNPYFPHAKECALKIESQLNNRSSPVLNDLLLISPKNILKLENALIENDSTSLDEIKEEYNLPEDFDFACIDIPNFLETMQATHEFDFANPNPAPINHSEREHMEVKENNGELEFGLV